MKRALPPTETFYVFPNSWFKEIRLFHAYFQDRILGKSTVLFAAKNVLWVFGHENVNFLSIAHYARQLSALFHFINQFNSEVEISRAMEAYNKAHHVQFQDTFLCLYECLTLILAEKVIQDRFIDYFDTAKFHLCYANIKEEVRKEYIARLDALENDSEKTEDTASQSSAGAEATEKTPVLKRQCSGRGRGLLQRYGRGGRFFGRPSEENKESKDKESKVIVPSLSIGS